MYNHNKAQQSKNRVHISWDILYILTDRYRASLHNERIAYKIEVKFTNNWQQNEKRDGYLISLL